MSPQTDTSSPLPLGRDPASVIREEGGPSQLEYPRKSGLPPEHRQWPRCRHKFWIYESPQSGSSQDGRSNASSGGNSTGSEGPEERRTPTVSPYGSFFAEEMDFDTPTESGSSYPGDGQENATVFTDMSRAFCPTKKPPPSWTTRSSQTQAAPVLFMTGHHPTHSGRPLGTVPVQDHNAPGTIRGPLSQSYLDENSRRSQAPDSWRQGPGCLDRAYNPHQAATALPPGRALPGQNERRMRGVDHGRRGK
jgi:hypothetical protein